jgi:hypothetical protein
MAQEPENEMPAAFEEVISQVWGQRRLLPDRVT